MNPLESLELQMASIEQFCAELGRMFRVRSHEVAVYGLQAGMLRFLHPVELRQAGAIPISSSTLAARTASSRRPECQNNVAGVRHSSVFETVKLSGTEGTEPSAMVIQKMISAPIFGPAGDVAGVVQVSRKGANLPSAGPDFTPDDLRTLEQSAGVLGRSMPRFMSAT